MEFKIPHKGITVSEFYGGKLHNHTTVNLSNKLVQIDKLDTARGQW